MHQNSRILAIIGSASKNSSNLLLVKWIAERMKNSLDLHIFNDLKMLPHFDPELSLENTPQTILDFRTMVHEADGILICTPEYVFSIPSGLKNAIEWCISTTVFSDKPTSLITASAQGEKGHEELKMIMKTAMCRFQPETTLLIQGIRGKVDHKENLTDPGTITELNHLLKVFSEMVKQNKIPHDP
ncbi:MAG TPA: NAD(P)H-dependent oxidoreductase [Catalimonadaceae bacterium]|nr:NAD(P)H-dependent oxidoreductase [Catalimonadaceae bacterium]